MINQSLIPMIMSDEVRMIAVKYDSTGKEYHFMTTDGSIEVGDEVLVHGGNSPRVVEVSDVDVMPKTDAQRDYRFIIQKVDYTTFDANDKLAKQLIEAHSKAQFSQWRKAMKAFFQGDAGIAALMSEQSAQPTPPPVVN